MLVSLVVSHALGTDTQSALRERAIVQMQVMRVSGE